MRPPCISTPKLPLHEWASLRTELVWIYDRDVLPKYLSGRAGSDSLPGYRLWLIRRGTVSLNVGRRRVTAGAGTWILIGRDILEHSFSPRAHILSVHFLCQWPSGENLIDNRETVMVKSERHPALEASARKMEQLLRESFPEEGAREQTYGEQSSDYEGFLRFQGLFLEWLAVWSKVCLENGGQLTRLISGDSRPFHAARCLNEARLDQPFPAEWLQRETGLGLLRLNQLFFKEFGLTTRKYWDRRRLDFAKQCLETSEMPLKEISYRIGFRSSSHFVIWFRRVVKLRPGEWRKNYRTRHADLAMRS